MIFSANDSVFRAEHAPLLRAAHFLSKARDILRDGSALRERCSTLTLEARYYSHYIYNVCQECVGPTLWVEDFSEPIRLGFSGEEVGGNCQ